MATLQRNRAGRDGFVRPRGEAFDERPMPGVDSEVLHFRAASESLAPVRKLSRADLDTLRLVTVYQGRKVRTVGGMLVFGRDRERHFPDAWIQAGRFQGTDKSRILDRADGRGLVREIGTGPQEPKRRYFRAE